ncbi:GNAT family N-acetyltransferase [Microbispora hainanensis]|uniref:N-acetyltransferase n=1 Tax=Microbispora hainanensis TaxID=568844 RepID=A0A544Z2A9_9ACTN|nr:N-acetyltransferase [Microbispora hainanensis]TQS23180.1 N-acetyltransferase [Microbispora hainanensis]
MLIRRENPGDIDAVRVVVAAAFAPYEAARNPGRPEGLPIEVTPIEVTPMEVTLLDELRTDPGWLPELSLVASAPEASPAPAPEKAPRGGIAGHVVCTRAHVGSVPVLGLGPLSVHPDHQRRGVGSALVHAVLGAAEALGTPLVGLLGSPAYYSRFGFEPAESHGVTAPDPAWGEYFQVRVFERAVPPPRGPFVYAKPFSTIDGG